MTVMRGMNNTGTEVPVSVPAWVGMTDEARAFAVAGLLEHALKEYACILETVDGHECEIRIVPCEPET